MIVREYPPLAESDPRESALQTPQFSFRPLGSLRLPLDASFVPSNWDTESYATIYDPLPNAQPLPGTAPPSARVATFPSACTVRTTGAVDA